MELHNKNKITVEVVIELPVEKVWKLWTEPDHIVHWNNASDEWHSPSASNDLKAGGKFVYKMEAKDGSVGFDFFGTYDRVVPHNVIEYTLGDNRKVHIDFTGTGGHTRLTEIFDAEKENTVEMQRNGWQAILDNFKRYAEEQ